MVRRSAARGFTYLLDNVLTKLEVTLDRVLDLSVATYQQATRELLVRADPTLCRALARSAREKGIQGLLVPSVMPGGTNIVILPENLPDPPPIRILDSVALPLETG